MTLHFCIPMRCLLIKPQSLKLFSIFKIKLEIYKTREYYPNGRVESKLRRMSQEIDAYQVKFNFRVTAVYQEPKYAFNVVHRLVLDLIWRILKLHDNSGISLNESLL